jgi:mannose-1-phosphate guanylyltransferase
VKAFLLAAGHGTRLRPLTDNMPKCMVPIRGRAMLDIWLEICEQAGIDEVLINLHAHSEPVRAALRQSKRGVTVYLSEEPVLLGSAGTLVCNRDWVATEEYFWVLYADVLTNANLNEMLQFHIKCAPAATIGSCRVKDPSRCGVITFDPDFLVQEFVEKPTHPRSDWVFSGLMIGTPMLLDSIPSRLPVDLGFDVLPRLVGRMRAYPISDYLTDVGTMQNYEAAQETWPGL